jgi:hypothetical protein
MLVLVESQESRDRVLARRVRLRDRLVARLRTDRLDAELAEGAQPDASPALALRAHELIGPSMRRGLARQIRRLVRDAMSGKVWVVAEVAPRRREVVEAADDLEALARRLTAPEPVSARGVAVVRRLLTDGTGPLYFHGADEPLRSIAAGALGTLEPVA